MLSEVRNEAAKLAEVEVDSGDPDIYISRQGTTNHRNIVSLSLTQELELKAGSKGFDEVRTLRKWISSHTIQCRLPQLIRRLEVCREAG